MQLAEKYKHTYLQKLFIAALLQDFVCCCKKINKRTYVCIKHTLCNNHSVGRFMVIPRVTHAHALSWHTNHASVGLQYILRGQRTKYRMCVKLEVHGTVSVTMYTWQHWESSTQRTVILSWTSRKGIRVISRKHSIATSNDKLHLALTGCQC